MNNSIDPRQKGPFLVTFASLIAAATACGPTSIERFDFDAQAVDIVDLSNDRGDIYISDGDEIEVVAELFGRAQAEHELEAGTLRLWQSCSPGAGRCAIDWYVTLPGGLDAIAETARGDLDVGGTDNNLTLSSGRGELTLSSVRAQILELDTDSGDIDVMNAEVETLAARSGRGEIGVTLRAQPMSVNLRSGRGDLTMTLPGGDYDLDLDTDRGEIEVAGAINDDSGSQRQLTLRTGRGDIDIFSR